MTPRWRRVTVYVGLLVSLTCLAAMRLLSIQEMRGREIPKFEGFSEAATCGKRSENDLAPDIAIESFETGKVSVELWEECGKSFIGYAETFGNRHALMLVPRYHMVFDEVVSVTFCLCARRFVYDLDVPLLNGDIIYFNGERGNASLVVQKSN